MIVRIVDGGHTEGLVRYLFGPGRANEHTNQHIIAGSIEVMDEFDADVVLSSADQTALAHELDEYMTLHGERPNGRARVWNSELGQLVDVKHGANHVWHASLSLSPDEAPLTDEQWALIAHDFMTQMGFEGDDVSPCQWVAVRHGLAKNGGDHIHIAANIVRADGTKFNRWQDQRHAQRAVNTIERTHGLRVIEAREHKRGARADSAQALNRAKAEGSEYTDRQILEQRLRAAAGAAENEADFVAHARTLGVRVRPRFAKGTTDVVTGYWAALHTKPGQQTRWWSATKIARDLTLSRLRDRWEDTPEGAMEAAQAWRAAWQGMPTGFDSAPTQRESMEERLRALNTYYERLAGVDPNNPVALADATSDLAALYAAAAQQEGLSPTVRRVYNRLARSTGRHAQLHSRTPWKNPTNPVVRQCAHLFLIARPHSHSDRSNRHQMWAAALTMIRLSNALAHLYETARQSETARDILRETQRLYQLVHQQPGVIEARDYYERLLTDAPRQQSNPTPQAHRHDSPRGHADVERAHRGHVRITQPDITALRRALRSQASTEATSEDYEPTLPATPEASERVLTEALRAARAATAMGHGTRRSPIQRDKPETSNSKPPAQSPNAKRGHVR